MRIAGRTESVDGAAKSFRMVSKMTNPLPAPVSLQLRNQLSLLARLSTKRNDSSPQRLNPWCQSDMPPCSELNTLRTGMSFSLVFSLLYYTIFSLNSRMGLLKLPLLNYVYKSRSDGGSFRLAGSGPTRALEFHTAPDYEAKSSYRVTVTVSDGKARPVSVAVTVRVTDVNEPPVITGPVTKSVPENSASVATYTATDPEGDRVTWSRAGTDGNRFQITESGGVLRFSPAPDYEGPTDATWVNTYQVTVTATDNGSPNKSATRAVTVTVTDVNEPPPTPSAPSVSAASSNGHERLSVSWSAPSTSGRPGLSDYDVQYRKSGASRWSAHSFTGTGTSTTISGLSTDTEYQVQVLARNAEGSSSWSSSGRGRTRPNTAPSFTSGPTSKSVAENSRSVGSYTATDAEGHSISWSLEGTDSGDFSKTVLYGVLSLSFGSDPDYESPDDSGRNNVYNVTVKAEDNGSPKKSSTRAVTVTVTDVNEPPPTPLRPRRCRRPPATATSGCR